MPCEIDRIEEISVGHRVFGHEGHCKHFHGHNYKFEFTITSDDGKFDDVGRIIDFSVIKTDLYGWLESHWDHRFLVYRHDTVWSKLKSLDSDGVVVVPFNPTVENMAQYFVEDVAPGLLIGKHVTLVRLRLWETSKCSATYTKESHDAGRR